MPTPPAVRSAHTISQDLIRRIQEDVLPRAQRCLNRSDERIRASVGVQSESTERLLDPEPAIAQSAER